MYNRVKNRYRSIHGHFIDRYYIAQFTIIPIGHFYKSKNASATYYFVFLLPPIHFECNLQSTEFSMHRIKFVHCTREVANVHIVTLYDDIVIYN